MSHRWFRASENKVTADEIKWDPNRLRIDRGEATQPPTEYINHMRVHFVSKVSASKFILPRLMAMCH